MTQLAHTFTRTLVEARKLDVAALRTTIDATRDDGLRAASYDGPMARSADVASHPERAVLHERRDRTADDLALVDDHVARFVGAVYELATRSHSGPFPNDWRTAVIGARRLVAMDAIGVLETSGQRPARFVHQAGDAVHDLALIAGRHMARKPDDHEKAWTSGLADEDCCKLCLDHVGLRVELKAKGRCQMHLRLFNDSGGIDAPEWLTREFRRIGTPSGPDWKRARSSWLQAEGVQDRSAS